MCFLILDHPNQCITSLIIVKLWAGGLIGETMYSEWFQKLPRDIHQNLHEFEHDYILTAEPWLVEWCSRSSWTTNHGYIHNRGRVFTRSILIWSMGGVGHYVQVTVWQASTWLYWTGVCTTKTNQQNFTKSLLQPGRNIHVSEKNYLLHQLSRFPWWIPYDRGLGFTRSIQCCRCKRVDIVFKSTCDKQALGFINLSSHLQHQLNENFAIDQKPASCHHHHGVKALKNSLKKV